MGRFLGRKALYIMILWAISLGISGVIALPDPAEAGVGAQLDLGTAISRVARENIPAVAHIEVTQRQSVTNPLIPFENDPFFRYFFEVPRMPRKFKRELKGLGTGMIIDTKGHILTNNHVVAGATEIHVLLSSGKKYQAKLVGTEPKTDLAVISISAKEDLPHVKFGDSDKTEVGEWVVAIGHPRGLDQTVTQGIISAKHRRGIMDPSTYQDFLQTDAAINPGNSGGPLLNLQGEVIGVNAAIVSQSGGFEGIGFAIPSNMALHIARQLIAHGKVERGWIGVTVQDVTQDLARSFGIKTPKGALVADVVKGGPADKANIKRGDVILTYRGKEIADAGSLRNEVALTGVGQVVGISVMRRAGRVEVLVRIGNIQDGIRMRVSSLKVRLGVDVRAVTPEEVKEYGLDAKRGVVIVWLDPEGPMSHVGFEVNDMILEINGQPLPGLESFADMVGRLRTHQRVTLLALDHRSGRTGYVQVVVQ